MIDLRKIVTDAVQDQSGEIDIEDDQNLRRDLGLESLDMIEIAMTIEEGTGVEISDDDLDTCQTLGDLIVMADRLYQARAVQ